MGVGDCSVTERRWWHPPYQTGKTVHVHAKPYQHEDGHTVPGVCANGLVPLSHSGNIVTRIGIPTYYTPALKKWGYTGLHPSLPSHGPGCVRQWFRTAEPLGERRYENRNTHFLYLIEKVGGILVYIHPSVLPLFGENFCQRFLNNHAS